MHDSPSPLTCLHLLAFFLQKISAAAKEAWILQNTHHYLMHKQTEMVANGSIFSPMLLERREKLQLWEAPLCLSEERDVFQCQRKKGEDDYLELDLIFPPLHFFFFKTLGMQFFCCILIWQLGPWYPGLQHHLSYIAYSWNFPQEHPTFAQSAHTCTCSLPLSSEKPWVLPHPSRGKLKGTFDAFWLNC